MVTERVILSFEARGTRRVTRNIDTMRKSAKSTTSALGFLRAALVVFASARVIGGFADLIDSFTNLQNKLKLITTGTAELNAVQDQLIQIAKETRVDLDATATVYQRVARSTLNLRLSFRDIGGLVTTLNQSLILSGATAQEARAGLIQFSQGLAAGALRGDELRSVVEGLPFLADIIGKEFGISGGALIAFAKSTKTASIGALNTKRVITALQKAAQEVDKRFKELTPTISQGFTLVTTSLKVFLGQTNEATGFSLLFGQALKFVADNFETLAKAVAVAGAALLAVFSARLLRRVALLAVANPFGVFLTGALAATSAIAFFTLGLGNASKSTINLLDVAEGVFLNIGKIAKATGGSLDTVFTNFATRSKITFRLIGLAVEQLGDSIVNSLVNGFKTAINAVIKLRNTVATRLGREPIALLKTGSVFGDEDAIKAEAQKLIKLRNELVASSNKAESEISSVLASNIVLRINARNKEAADRIRRQKLLDNLVRGRRTGGITDPADAKARAKLIKQLEKLRASVSPLAAARQKLAEVTTLLNKAEKAGLTTKAESAELLRRVTRDLVDVGNATTDYKEKILVLSDAFNRGAISTAEFAMQSRKLRIEFLETQDTIAAGAERGFLKFAAEGDSAGKAIENALTSTFQNVEDALVKFVETGKFSFKDLANSILKDLTRIAVKQALVQAANFAISGLSGLGGGGTAGIGADLGTVLAGFQDGGQVKIGGSGGPDSQLFAAKVTPGETVTFTPPGESVGGITINFTVNANDAESFNRSRDQIMGDLAFTINRANRRNN